MITAPDLVPFILTALKILMIIALGSDLIFSLIFLTKIRLLSKIVETERSPVVLVLAVLNFIAALALLLAAAFLL